MGEKLKLFFSTVFKGTGYTAKLLCQANPGRNGRGDFISCSFREIEATAKMIHFGYLHSDICRFRQRKMENSLANVCCMFCISALGVLF